jgi:hypothetical protein
LRPISPSASESALHRLMAITLRLRRLRQWLPMRPRLALATVGWADIGIPLARGTAGMPATGRGLHMPAPIGWLRYYGHRYYGGYWRR